jgi:hypothetical protein
MSFENPTTLSNFSLLAEVEKTMPPAARRH